MMLASEPWILIKTERAISEIRTEEKREKIRAGLEYKNETCMCKKECELVTKVTSVMYVIMVKFTSTNQ